MIVLRKYLLPVFSMLAITAAHADPTSTQAPAASAVTQPAAAAPPAQTPLTAAVPADGGATAPQGPSPMEFPAIADAMQGGAKAYYLGKRDGLDGWFLAQDNQVRIFYASPNHKVLIVGNMFGPEGYDVSTEQLKSIVGANPEIAQSIQQQLSQAAANPNNARSMPAYQNRSARQAPNSTQQMPSVAQRATVGDTSLAKKTLIESLPPGDRLAGELDTAAAVNVGAADAPLLYMIMDPNCPHCQATWKAIRAAVFNNTVRVRLIPIGNNDEQERAAAELLLNKDPLNAWDKYVAGDKAQLAGSPDAGTLDRIRSNHVIVDRWSIKVTPYMLYRGKSGTLQIVAGEPKDPAALLAGIGP